MADEEIATMAKTSTSMTLVSHSLSFRDPIAAGATIVLAASACFSAGAILMTHMHHRGLAFVRPELMQQYDSGYEILTEFTIVPASIIGLACCLTLLVLRPAALPMKIPVAIFILLVGLLVARLFTWGVWAEDVRAHGSIWMQDGALHPSYTLYMDWNWIRVAVVWTHALLALTLAGRLMVTRIRFAGHAL